MFGLQIVAKDKERQAGAPGQRRGRRRMDAGSVRPDRRHPGAIYKIDGATGKASLFATIKLDDRDNAGPALGNITFDAKTRQLFVSDLETGMIHRLTLDGKERDVFDHGSSRRARRRASMRSRSTTAAR